MKKYLKLAVSVLLVTLLMLAPNTVAAPALIGAVPAETVKVTENTAPAETDKTEVVASSNEKEVTINSETVSEWQNEDDIIYEPEQESITVLDDSSAYVNDALSVFFKDGTSEADKQAVVKSVDGEIVGDVGFMNQYEVKIARSDINEITALCDELMENDAVEFASCTLANEYTDESIPDDPWGEYYSWSDTANNRAYSYNNWWIKAIDADKAWDYEDYFSHIKIGIVDSGFDTEHEDLQGKITFPSKFFAKRNAPTYHGTHVAGIIGAEHDNGIGISGVVKDCELVCVDWQANKDQDQHWNSEVRIMTGFINAVRSGAKVINFSLGSSGTIKNGTTDRYKFVKDIEAKYASYVVAKLLQRGYDFICCQSAGNGVDMKDGSSYAVDASNNGTFCTITKENAVKFVIGVTPEDILDRIIIVASAAFGGYNTYYQSYFSNGGSQVSICAPGSSIYSTYYNAEDEDYDYARLSGTSMAAPIVTGVASLVWSVNQNFTGAQVKHFVCDIENTKYIVKDSDDETHLPEGDIPMVNAQLAVEAAIKANSTTGKVEGEIVSTADEISVEIVNDASGEVYRVLVENGKITAELPEGDYTISKVGDTEYDEKFSVVNGETTVLEPIIISGIDTGVSEVAETVISVIMDNI